MENTILTAQIREKSGKGAARATRRNNLVPGVVYGNKKDPIAIALDPKQLNKEAMLPNVFSKIYSLKIDNKEEEVLIRDIQYHPVKDHPIHVDMLRIGKDTKAKISIPIVFSNQDKSHGLKFGGILNIIVHSLEVLCHPKSAPENIEINLEGTKVGNVIKIEDIKLPEGVKTLYPKGFAIASITATEDSTEENTTE